MRSIYILLAPLLLFSETKLADIEITAEPQSQEEESDFLVQKESFLSNAPMQQQLTTKQALGIAGTNGDPIFFIKSLFTYISCDFSLLRRG